MFEYRQSMGRELLKRVATWSDPWPVPVIERVLPNVFVVRDDLLEYGSKVRGLDYLIGHDPEFSHVHEWVFGSCPATGYAQISLPAVTKRYNKKTVLFMAARAPERYHEYQKRGLAAGAEYHWVPNGMLPVTQARAREYAAAQPNRMVLPLGLEHTSVLAAFVKVANSLTLQHEPDIIVSVASSGTLNRALQYAWPSAKAYAVQVGHQLTEHNRGDAEVLVSPYKFDKPIKASEAPPFPSAPTYDAKAWPFVVKLAQENQNKVIYLWNVGA